MEFTYELNNIVNIAPQKNLSKRSPVCEVFAAWVANDDPYTAKLDDKVIAKSQKYIQDTAARAVNGDYQAIAEINSMRRFYIEDKVLAEIKLLSVFGSFTRVGENESIEREVWDLAGEKSRLQAAGGDVPYAQRVKMVYPVPTYTLSAGYAVDYRQMAVGDMTKEQQGMELVRTDLMNKAQALLFKKACEAVKNASPVNRYLEENGLTKAGVDKIIGKIRRYGRPVIAGDNSVLGQFNSFAGYVGKIDTTTVTGTSDQMIEEIRANGLVGAYNGALLQEMENPYDFYSLNAAGDDFNTLLPQGAALVIPTRRDGSSPIGTWVQGGLTSLQGNNVKTGQVEIRFDIKVAIDVAKTHEHEIGVIYDTAIGGLE